MDYNVKFLRAIMDSVDDLARQGPVGNPIDLMAAQLRDLRGRGGRLFVMGSGGGAAHASHACCDFRKLCGIECYCPSDNSAELTARTNDDGWSEAYSGWLRASRIGEADAILVISVGGGDLERGISPNLAKAVMYARQFGATVLGICGRDGGYTKRMADLVVMISAPPDLCTPVVESVQAVVLHLLATHPWLKRNEAKWEGACGNS